MITHQSGAPSSAPEDKNFHTAGFDPQCSYTTTDRPRCCARVYKHENRHYKNTGRHLGRPLLSLVFTYINPPPLIRAARPSAAKSAPRSARRRRMRISLSLFCLSVYLKAIYFVYFDTHLIGFARDIHRRLLDPAAGAHHGEKQ